MLCRAWVQPRGAICSLGGWAEVCAPRGFRGFWVFKGFRGFRGFKGLRCFLFFFFFFWGGGGGGGGVQRSQPLRAFKDVTPESPHPAPPLIP